MTLKLIPILSLALFAFSCGGEDVAPPAVKYSPDASADFYTINEDAVEASYDVLDNDSDRNGGALTLVSVDSVVENGTASVDSNVILFTPDADYSGLITFSYTIEDNTGLQDSAIVSIEVLAVNDAPRSDGITATIPEDSGPHTFDAIIDSNATDIEGDAFFLDSISDPDNGGTAFITGDSVTYSPAADFWGVETFTFTLSDGTDSSVHTVEITVEDADDLLIVNNGTASTDEDVAVEIDLADYAINVDDQILTLDPASLTVSPPINGTVAHVNGTIVLYTPNANYNTDEKPNDIFSFTLSDGFTDEVGAVTLTVNPVNDAPTSDAVTATTEEDSGYFVDVLEKASDIDTTDVLSISSFLSTSQFGGTVSEFEGKLVYNPAPNNNNFITGADDVITYYITDGTAVVALTATVTVTPVDDPIVVADGFANTEEDLFTLVDLEQLVTNVDFDVLTLDAFSSTGSSGGEITLADPATPLVVRYQPAANYSGAELFSFEVGDGDNDDAGFVTMTVIEVNDVPTGADATLTVAEDSNSSSNVFDLVIAAALNDVDGDTLEITLPTASANGGVISSNTQGDFTYAPPLNFNSTINGDDSVVATVDDQRGGIISITVTFVVTAEDDPLVTQNITIAAHEEDTTVAYDIIALGVIDNFDEDPITIISFDSESTQFGTVVQSPPGTLIYTPAADFNSVDLGSDTVFFTLDDGDTQYPHSLVITVFDVNDPPVANDHGTASATEDTLETYDVVSSFVTDVDPASTTSFTITSAIALSGAAITIDTLGQEITYQAPLNYNTFLDGPDVITYTVQDNSGAANNFDSGSITVNVASVNDPPTIGANFPIYATEDVEVALIDVFTLSNATDVDGIEDTLTISAVDAGGASVNILGGGNVSYQSTLDLDTTETITFTISDDDNATVDVDMHVDLTPVNDAPRNGDFATAVDEDNTLSLDLVSDSGAVDMEGDAMSVFTADATSVNGGTVVLVGNNVDYTPAQDFEGVDTFTFVLTDSQPTNSESDIFTATVTVNPINDAPVATDGTDSCNEDNPASTDVIALSSDVDTTDVLSISDTTDGDNGSCVIAGDSIDYTPNADFNGVDSYTYTITDGNGGFDTASVTITVLAVNDPPRNGNFATAVDEDNTLSLDLVSDSGAEDVDGDAMSVFTADAESENGGTVVLVGNNVDYTPAQDFEGVDTFTFVLTDSQPTNSESDIFTATVTVNPIADAPVANDDSFSDPNLALAFWRWSEPLEITADVLANDTDGDAGDVLSLDSIDNAGTTGFAVLATGVLTYEPALGVSGVQDTFTYDVTDGDINTANDTATVTIDIADNNSVKFQMSGGGVQPTGWSSHADVFGYGLLLDVPGDYPTLMRISDVDPLNLGNIVWQFSMKTPGDPTVALLQDVEVASNTANEVTVAAVYINQSESVVVTGFNFDGSISYSAVLSSAVAGDVTIEGLALDGTGGCVIGLRLSDSTLRVVHLNSVGVVVDRQEVDSAFGTINSIANIGGDYYLAMSTGVIKLDSALLGVYYFGDIAAPFNINSVRNEGSNVVVAGSDGYLALIDETVPGAPTTTWSIGLIGPDLETIEFSDLVSDVEDDIYAVGQTSDSLAAFYSVDSAGAENFEMKVYGSIGDSAAFTTLIQAGVATVQSIVGSMVSPDGDNFFRLEAFNTDGAPVTSCSDYGVVDSGFATTAPAAMSIVAIVDVADTDISSSAGPTTIGLPIVNFQRRANL